MNFNVFILLFSAIVISANAKGNKSSCSWNCDRQQLVSAEAERANQAGLHDISIQQYDLELGQPKALLSLRPSIINTGFVSTSYQQNIPVRGPPKSL